MPCASVKLHCSPSLAKTSRRTACENAADLRSAHLSVRASGFAEALFLELCEQRIEGAVEHELEAAVRNAVTQ